MKPGSQAELRRCIASGRSQRVCFSEVLGNGMSQLTGINLKTASKPGLRMTGHYAGPGGFRLIFQPDSVTMVCKEVPAPRPYGVEVTEAQGLVKIQNGSQQIVLTMRPDGKLSGAGPVRVAGQVPAGTRTEETMGLTPQTTTSERQLGPGEQRLNPNAKQNGPVYTVTEQATEWVYGPTGTHTVTNYVTKTADCNLGLLTPIGPTPLPPDIENPFGLLTTIFSGASTLMNGGSANDALNDMLNLDKAAPPGLRMSGRYAGKSGFGITFHPESATVACGDAELAHEYSVERTANQILLKIRDKTSPLSLQLKPDGSLFGEGMVQVNGRDIVGTTDDPKNPFVFTPKIGRCAVGSLIAGAPIITPPTASTGTAGVPSSATSIPPMANAVQSGGSAPFSIVSGLQAPPGGANPLAGRTFLVLSDSLENILARAGWRSQGSSGSAISAWMQACDTGAPSCRVGSEQLRPYIVANATLDKDGRTTFPDARTGTYYLFGRVLLDKVNLVWDLRVDLRPGANSVTLDQRNATPIGR